MERIAEPRYPLPVLRAIDAKLPSPAMPRARFHFLAIFGFLLVFPFFLRRRPRVERRIAIFASPEDIFALIADLRQWPNWTSWGQDESMQYSYGAISEGMHAVQHWNNASMDGILRIVRCDTGARLDYELEMGLGQYQVKGRIDLTPDGACTRVVWRCVWEPARNPYLRYGDLFYQWVMGRQFAESLANLKMAAEKRSSSRPLAS